MDYPEPSRYMHFADIDWTKTFYKTYFERRSAVHMLVNFNRIWILHISVFWFYTAFNSPTVYAPPGKTVPTTAMQWSATALGGGVATAIMILATIAELAYIPPTWTNFTHLGRRMLFLIAILAITVGPTLYIALVDGTSNVAIALAAVQFAVAVIAVILFSIVPTGRMFGDRVAGRSRKYLASQTFTAAYPELPRSARAASIAMWTCIFLCKFVESYFFITTPFASPIRAMARVPITQCRDRLFGTALCRNQMAFALTIM